MDSSSILEPTFVLVPGAWMGGVEWQSMVDRLSRAGYRAHTLTLTGLDPCWAEDLADVDLESHVADVVELLEGEDLTEVVLVAHSYSGIVVGQVADRAPERVRRSVYVASFLPRNGRSLIDDWGKDEQMRAQERQDILDNDLAWAPPPAEGLAAIGDLSEDDREWLADNLVDHPGNTVLDEVRMNAPITEQSLTFVATAPEGEDPLAELPPELAGTVPKRWRLRTMASGHWPTLSKPDELVALLIEEAR